MVRSAVVILANHSGDGALLRAKMLESALTSDGELRADNDGGTFRVVDELSKPGLMIMMLGVYWLVETRETTPHDGKETKVVVTTMLDTCARPHVHEIAAWCQAAMACEA